MDKFFQFQQTNWKSSRWKKSITFFGKYYAFAEMGLIFIKIQRLGTFGAENFQLFSVKIFTRK